MIRLALAHAAFVFAWLLSTSAPGLAQESLKPAEEKWRPKEGIYAETGTNFGLRCGEGGDLVVDLKDNYISGNEWGCKVTRLSDTAAGAIRLDMICDDYNLAELIKDPNWEKRKFKETMLLRRKDRKSVLVRKTLNGKFAGPEWHASYCPEEDQRMDPETKASYEAEIQQKAAEERLRLAPWRPRDGIYATPGENFTDRCQKYGDAIIDFSERSISSGDDKCSITFIRDELDAIHLFAICSEEPNAQGPIARAGDAGSIPPRSSETIILKKSSANTVFMERSRDGNFTDPGRQLSYCGQDVQGKYAQQKTRK
jgi:hypothetical protein